MQLKAMQHKMIVRKAAFMKLGIYYIKVVFEVQA